MSTFVFQSIFKPIIFWNSLLPEKLLEPFIQQASIDTYSEQASKNSLYQNHKVFFYFSVQERLLRNHLFYKPHPI